MYAGALSDRVQRIATIVREEAKPLATSPAALALAWLQSRSPKIIPIVGARGADQLRQSLACLNLTLSPETLARLDEASAVSLGFPHDFLNAPGVRQMIYAGVADKIAQLD